jgi:23S rRNA (cytosine1962-C5)-methyltransferase
MNPRIYSAGWDDYELLDAGDGKKLERWGNIITIRPELQAYFKPGDTAQIWRTLAHWEFIETGKQSGMWQSLKPDTPKRWTIRYRDLHFQLELTRYKHLGLFPEQRCNWDFISEHLTRDDRFLNLFAYTGAASCIARQTGAETLHVDSVKQLLTWAHSNMENSGLSDIKWVREDALKFVERELKRGKSYHGIQMDPPAWGLGAKGEQWKLEHQLKSLLSSAQGLLSKNGFLVLNTYSPSVSLTDIKRLAHQYFKPTNTLYSELWMKTSKGKELYYGNVLRAIKA